jgi:hypothetical protein
MHLGRGKSMYHNATRAVFVAVVRVLGGETEEGEEEEGGGRRRKRRRTTEERIQLLDRIVGRMFQLRAQLAAGQWPPEFNEPTEEHPEGRRRTGGKPRARH